MSINLVKKSENKKVFFDITIDDEDAGRLEFELYSKDLPKTTENFRALCTGEKGYCINQPSKPLHYMDTLFHRIIPGFMAQGGDITKGNGTGGESIYGKSFQDESFLYAHDAFGKLSMANKGPNSNDSQFFITFGEHQHLDILHVCFGQLISGHDVLKKIEKCGTSTGITLKKVRITASGEFRPK